MYMRRRLQRIFTDAHLHIDTVFDTLTAFIDEIERFYADNGMIMSRRADGIDLVLDLVKSEHGTGGMLCGYYFVDHPERIVFWDDAFELDRLSHGRDVRGVTSAHHIKTELAVQFWLHCQLFPSAIEVTTELIAELRDVLIHHIGDAMTSPTSTVADSVEDLLKMLTVVESMQENAQANFSGCACILGRFMWKFTSQMFYHFYGEPCARLDKTQSVYGHVTRHSLLIKIIAPILLNAPLTHLRMLEEVYADENVSHVQWRRFIERLDQEWQQLALFATVLLNADIAFLAIPTVDSGEHAPRSVAQIVTYVSVVASLGSVVVGLFLSRLNHDQRDAEDYVDEAVSMDTFFQCGQLSFCPNQGRLFGSTLHIALWVRITGHLVLAPVLVVHVGDLHILACIPGHVLSGIKHLNPVSCGLRIFRYYFRYRMVLRSRQQVDSSSHPGISWMGASLIPRLEEDRSWDCGSMTL
ncbi:hypothetical protein C8R45DRAFT_270680 [Mycena sanguinolenta]|nr:hypothetical protein C8R45DRAFT_270680 [Mycena sanguinolenta]